MGRVTITLPRLGETMEEARVTDWLVPVGAAFGGVMARWYGLRTPFIVAGVALTLIALGSRRILRPIRLAVG